MSSGWPAQLGAVPADDGGCHFLVWAPRAEQVDVHFLGAEERLFPLAREPRGYFNARAENVPAGTNYQYRLNGQTERPDPASRFQPDGPHGPSQVVDADFPWQANSWTGIALEDYALYEIHVGTFTPQGTFDAVIPRLAELRELGVTAIELMPVAQFPGARNWGYDGTFPFAAQNSYGGPRGLQRLVDAAHAHGLAVVLDVVYNHLGPEGNYLGEFGHYFTDAYRTPWGNAVNFDGAHSDEVRRYFIESALYWVRDCRIDALRLDAVHAISDASPYPFLEELGEAVHAEARRTGRRIHLMPESDRNDARLIRPAVAGGYGLDAVWNDDFHHAVHVLTTAERSGYYADFGLPEEGGTSQLAASFRDGFIYSGQYSEYRQRRQGTTSRGFPGKRFVVFAQNHDQVGNRMLGERLTALVDFERLKLAAGAVLLSPFLPLLFMGEEYAEPAPFQYFISHEDAALVEAVRQGRREEFARFHWKGEIPDPQDEKTFAACRLNWDLRGEGHHAQLLALYKELLRLRRELAALSPARNEPRHAGSLDTPPVVWLHREAGGRQVLALFHFGAADAEPLLDLPRGQWQRVLDSADARWGGPGARTPEKLDTSRPGAVALAPWNFALFTAEGKR